MGQHQHAALCRHRTPSADRCSLGRSQQHRASRAVRCSRCTRLTPARRAPSARPTAESAPPFAAPYSYSHCHCHHNKQSPRHIQAPLRGKPPLYSRIWPRHVPPWLCPQNHAVWRKCFHRAWHSSPTSAPHEVLNLLRRIACSCLRREEVALHEAQDSRHSSSSWWRQPCAQHWAAAATQRTNAQRLPF